MHGKNQWSLLILFILMQSSAGADKEVVSSLFLFIWLRSTFHDSDSNEFRTKSVTRSFCLRRTSTFSVMSFVNVGRPIVFTPEWHNMNSVSNGKCTLQKRNVQRLEDYENTRCYILYKKKLQHVLVSNSLFFSFCSFGSGG